MKNSLLLSLCVSAAAFAPPSQNISPQSGSHPRRIKNHLSPLLKSIEAENLHEFREMFPRRVSAENVDSLLEHSQLYQATPNGYEIKQMLLAKKLTSTQSNNKPSPHQAAYNDHFNTGNSDGLLKAMQGRSQFDSQQSDTDDESEYNNYMFAMDEDLQGNE